MRSSDVPGLTRDRKYGYLHVGSRSAVVIDTGGLIETQAGIERLMAEQTLKAVEEADRVLFVVDAREGTVRGGTSTSWTCCGAPAKPVLLTLNKTEGLDADIVAVDFHRLGLGAGVAVSATRGSGLGCSSSARSRVSRLPTRRKRVPMRPARPKRSRSASP
jgi:GTP-binding protein